MKTVYKWTVALVLLGFLTAGVFLTVAPEQIPVHFDLSGRIDRWGSKYEFLVMPVINVLFAAFMAWVARREGRQGRDMNERIVSLMNNGILVLFDGLWLFFMWQALVMAEHGLNVTELPVKGLMLLLTASFIPLGNILPKAQRNSLFGLRTKWSMANDHCWQQSQRIGGYIMVVTGFLGVILTAVLPAGWGGYVLLALVAAMTVACIWASYRIYMRSQVQ